MKKKKVRPSVRFQENKTVEQRVLAVFEWLVRAWDLREDLDDKENVEGAALALHYCGWEIRQLLTEENKHLMGVVSFFYLDLMEEFQPVIDAYFKEATKLCLIRTEDVFGSLAKFKTKEGALKKKITKLFKGGIL